MPTSIKEVVEKYPTIKFEGYAAWDEENPMKPPFSRQFINITGQKFNHLTVLDLFPFKDKDKRPLWIVECDCDAHTIFVVSGKRLRNGGTKSCGCAQVASVTARNLKHGFSYRGERARIYGIYHDMVRRCYDERRGEYYRYGGRGIRICDEWLGENGFINFYNWSIENGYYEQDNKVVPKGRLLSIERHDPNGNYCPENCAWIPFYKQSRNKRNTISFCIAGIRVTSGDICEYFEIDPDIVATRYRENWTLNEILYSLINSDEDLSRINNKYTKRIHYGDNRIPLVPNYATLNPYSKDKAERKLAKIYLSDDFIKFILNIKINTRQ